MNDPEITKILSEMLGNNAYGNQFEVESDFRKLALCVDYLAIQINITKRWCDEDGKQHIDDVIKSAKEILTEK